jgi:hypothetical protein
MTRRRLRPLLIPALGVCLAGATLLGRSQRTPPPSLHWYKGNTHTHTLNSDGDSTPDDVVRWYREHGYQFLVLTDHNFQTRVEELNALHGADEKFLIVKGEEVTSTATGKPVHVNGLDANNRIGTQSGAPESTVLDVLQRCHPRGIRSAAHQPSELRVGAHHR